MHRTYTLLVTLLLLCLVGTLTTDAAPREVKAKTPKILTRIFFQDDESHTLNWANLLATEPPRLGPVQPVSGFPKLDSERQTLVQMQAAQGMILVGVRDDDDGAFQSGWVLIDAGVEQEDHGNHSHWRYSRPPAIVAKQLDEKQGNPAHLYQYDDVFYLANDHLGGFTRIDPRDKKVGEKSSSPLYSSTFFPGGGGHITLAVHDGKIAYSSWIDREGPNKGRIDVTPLNNPSSKEPMPQIGYSFHLPHGGIHGLTICQNKVFFAPSDGICWMQSNLKLPFANGQAKSENLPTTTEPKLDPQAVPVHHLSLGRVDDKPLRTGSFDSSGRFVGLVTGAGAKAAAGFIDAGRDKIEVTLVPLGMSEGARPVGPTFVKPRRGNLLAFVFHDHPEVAAVKPRADQTANAAPNTQVNERLSPTPEANKCQLSVIEITAASDGSLVSAQKVQTLDVGKCKVNGHSGHHSVDFDGDRRCAVMTNPGEGTVVVLDLEKRQPRAEFKVGGVPSKIICMGGRE